MKGEENVMRTDKNFYQQAVQSAVCGLVLLMAGCATLPKSVPVGEEEAQQVRQQFTMMLHEQRKCPPAIDADVSVTVDNALWAGTLSGYLRAMAPGYLRIEGVNPLGLTEALFAVDGEEFTYVSVRNQEAYLGPLTAEKISNVAPQGMAIQMNYYLLLGRIPSGELGIGEIGLDADGQGHWLTLRYTATDERAMVLIDHRQHLVKRHLLLDGSETIATDFSYDYPATEQGGSDCALPAKVGISKRDNGSISLSFTKRYPTPAKDIAPFRITPPEGYKRIVFQ